jgi:hypothetical protein
VTYLQLSALVDDEDHITLCSFVNKLYGSYVMGKQKIAPVPERLKPDTFPLRE